MERHTFLVGGNSRINPDGQDWIGGDGGPLIVLQATAAAQWQGASGYGLINGGDQEEDYDVVCEAEDNFVHRYGRDTLVLDDSSWSGQMFGLVSGVVALVQWYYEDGKLPDIVERAMASIPERSFPFVVEDTSIRLLVGADDGNGGSYGYIEAPVVPETKQCDLYRFDDGLVFLMSGSGLVLPSTL